MPYQPPHSFLMWQEKNKNSKLKIEVKKNKERLMRCDTTQLATLLMNMAEKEEETN